MLAIYILLQTNSTVFPWKHTKKEFFLSIYFKWWTKNKNYIYTFEKFIIFDLHNENNRHIETMRQSDMSLIPPPPLPVPLLVTESKKEEDKLDQSAILNALVHILIFWKFSFLRYLTFYFWIAEFVMVVRLQ